MGRGRLKEVRSVVVERGVAVVSFLLLTYRLGSQLLPHSSCFGEGTVANLQALDPFCSWLPELVSATI